MWAVVHFTVDNSVDYVPSSWIRKNGISLLCGWPNNDSSLKNFRSNRVHPNKKDFTYYKCRIISKDIASLSEAKIKAEKAQFTSDVSDVDNYKKKPKIKSSNKSAAAVFEKKSPLAPGYFSEYVDADCIMVKNDDGFKLYESDECSENLSTIDDSDVDKDYMPINKDEKQEDATEIWLTKDSEVNYQNMDTEDTPNSKPDVNTSFETHNNCETRTLSQSQSSLQSKQIDPVNSQSFIGFQKATLNYLAFLKVEIAKIADNQQQLLEYMQSNNFNKSQGSAGNQNWEHEVDYFIQNWPISTNEELMNMEEKIKLDVNFKNQVVWELARVGGKSLKGLIYRIMKKVFDDQLLISFTYYGLRNKENFSRLGINKAIFEAVKNKSSFKNSSEDEIITSIGKWLTCAKGRLLEKNKIK
ncbi:uncharacterized protein LOC126553272 [Aphis gossypii]|uniref:uncharacterized protein LOC126553272 n=1 Tax=Aphis gossypii TaxID=80765 RepID=UPI002158E1D3|nr:uncharacterized protein LOC126553272 [Aphis gossypii]